MRKSHVEIRLEQQIALSRIIATSYDELVKSGFSNITSTRIQSHSASLKEDWEKFSLGNDAISNAIRELSYEDQLQVQRHPYLQDNIFTVTKQLHLNSLEKMTALLETEATTSDNSTSGQMALQVSTTMPYSYTYLDWRFSGELWVTWFSSLTCRRKTNNWLSEALCSKRYLPVSKSSISFYFKIGWLWVAWS